MKYLKRNNMKLTEAVKRFKEIFGFKPKWECYEINVVQARMYGCRIQCKECKEKQYKKK
jgi:hypothetical protein